MYGSKTAIRRISILGIAAMAALAVFAAACGDDDDDDNGTDVTPPAASTATREATSAAETPDATSDATASATGEPVANDTTISVGDGGGLGPVLVGPAGMTLYTFMNDSPGGTASSCTGSCAQAWPPLAVTDDPTASSDATGTLATISRDDGSTQVTYNGSPLYYFAGDEAPGDTKGEGVGGVWFVAKP